MHTGDVLALVHAADAASAERARQTLLTCIQLSEQPSVMMTPVMVRRVLPAVRLVNGSHVPLEGS